MLHRWCEAAAEDVDEKVRELVDRTKRLEKEVQQLKSKLASGHGGDLSAQAKDVGGVKVLAAQIDGADARSLRDAMDQLKGKLGSSVIVLASVQDGKVVLVAGVSDDLIARMKAGDIAGVVAAKVGGGAAAAERISRKPAARSPKICRPHCLELKRWFGVGYLIERSFGYSDNKRYIAFRFLVFLMSN